MAWIQALRQFFAKAPAIRSAGKRHSPTPSYSTNPSPSSSGAAEEVPPCPHPLKPAALFQIVAREHLSASRGGAPGPDSLALLRQLRWELLGKGSSHEQAQLLGSIVKCYADAMSNYTHDGSDATSEEAQLLMLELVQCLVEAKAMRIPLHPVHCCSLLATPQLASISAELPLLLLSELEWREATRSAAQGTAGSLTLSNTPLLAGAREDCAVGFLRAGRWVEVLGLYKASPEPFSLVNAARRTASSQRGGWLKACQLASHLPFDWVNRTTSNTGPPGLSPAKQLQLLRFVEQCFVWKFSYHEASDPKRRGVTFDELCQYIEACVKKGRSEEDCSSSQRETVPTMGMERLVYAALKVCPADRWQEALLLVDRYGAAMLPNDAATSQGSTRRVTDAGELMKFLNRVGKPLLALEVHRDVTAHARETNLGTGEKREIPHSMANPNRTALRLQAFAALIAVNRWEDALQLFSQEGSTEDVMCLALLDAALTQRQVPLQSVWVACLDAYNTIMSAPRHGGRRPQRTSQEVNGYGEQLALWCATTGRWELAVDLARRVGAGSRYAMLAALAACIVCHSASSASQRERVEAMHHIFYSLCDGGVANQYKASVKQLCLATVMLASTVNIRHDQIEQVIASLETRIASQEDFDRVIVLLAEYISSVRQRFRADRPESLQRQEEANVDLSRDRMLGNTIDVLRNFQPDTEILNGTWKVALQIIRSIAERRRLCTASAAPVMLARGVSADVAIHFFPLR